jgi:alanine-glyoxylate transaminase/serine-glyoxylate transaminase/serine-pyruvate transaminase
MGYWGGGAKRSYHHTAPVNALYALHEALRVLAGEGLERSWQRHAAMHELLREGLERHGVRFVVDAPHRLPQLNSVHIPAGVDDASTRSRLLQEFNLEIGAGLGELAGRAWRIGLMGYGARRENVALCLKALETVLS